MNAIQSKIVALFDTLSPAEQEELAEHLYQRSRPSFLAHMSAEQKAELDAAIAEADRGEGSNEDEVFDRLGLRMLNWHRAVLERRLGAHRASPDEAVSWETIRAELLEELQRK